MPFRMHVPVRLLTRLYHLLTRLYHLLSGDEAEWRRSSGDEEQAKEQADRSWFRLGHDIHDIVDDIQ